MLLVFCCTRPPPYRPPPSRSTAQSHLFLFKLPKKGLLVRVSESILHRHQSTHPHSVTSLSNHHPAARASQLEEGGPVWFRSRGRWKENVSLLSVSILHIPPPPVRAEISQIALPCLAPPKTKIRPPTQSPSASAGPRQSKSVRATAGLAAWRIPIVCLLLLLNPTRTRARSFPTRFIFVS